jgi:hypothetical protein
LHNKNKVKNAKKKKKSVRYSLLSTLNRFNPIKFVPQHKIPAAVKIKADVGPIQLNCAPLITSRREIQDLKCNVDKEVWHIKVTLVQSPS